MELQPGQRLVYWGSGSPPAWRVQLALEEKQLEYQDQLVSFASGVLRTPEMLEMNPRGMVPIFVDYHDSAARPQVLYESQAILNYLEFAYPETSLMPDDVCSYALAQMRMNEANNLSVTTGEAIFVLRRKAAGMDSVACLQTKARTLVAELLLWERYLAEAQEAGGEYLVGSTVTLADLTFFPSLAYLVRCGLPLGERLPQLARYYTLMEQRDSVQATWPPHWRESCPCPVLSDVLGIADGTLDMDCEAIAARTEECERAKAARCEQMTDAQRAECAEARIVEEQMMHQSREPPCADAGGPAPASVCGGKRDAC